MEPLQRLFKLSTARGMLAPLARSGAQQRESMFADDVMVFFKPSELESRVCRAILDEFGHASGLWVNMAKSAAMGIRCPQDDLNEVCALLGCTSGAFPCKYLGLQLAI